jgi:hypothetical protein
MRNIIFFCTLFLFIGVKGQQNPPPSPPPPQTVAPSPPEPKELFGNSQNNIIGAQTKSFVQNDMFTFHFSQQYYWCITINFCDIVS